MQEEVPGGLPKVERQTYTMLGLSSSSTGSKSTFPTYIVTEKYEINIFHSQIL